MNFQSARKISFSDFPADCVVYTAFLKRFALKNDSGEFGRM
jgi:hypothetical protein